MFFTVRRRSVSGLSRVARIRARRYTDRGSDKIPATTCGLVARPDYRLPNK